MFIKKNHNTSLYYLKLTSFWPVYILLVISVIASFPHYLVERDIWDGTIFIYAFETKNYDLIKDTFQKVNNIHLSYFFILLDKIRIFFGLEISLALDITKTIFMFFSSASFYLFLRNGLRVEKNISVLFSSLYCFLPIFTLLTSAIFFTVLLYPTLIFAGLGLFHTEGKIKKYIGIFLLFLVTIFPVHVPFIMILIAIIYLRQINYVSTKKNLLNIATPLVTSILGLLFYIVGFEDISAGYKYYGSWNNFTYGLDMFLQYSEFLFISLTIPISLVVYKITKDPKLTFLLVLFVFVLVVVSVIPYALYNKQPICVIDTNCKENIYDWRERHAMMLLFSFFIMSAIAMNFSNSFSRINKCLLICLTSLIFLYSLLPVYILNHKRNVIREAWMTQISEQIAILPKKYNFVQVIMPSTGILYRLRSYDFDYLAYKQGRDNVVFSLTMVDARHATSHKDYFIVPDEPDFKKVVRDMASRVKTSEYIKSKRMLHNWKAPLCGARYIISSVDPKLYDLFDMEKNDITKWDISYFPKVPKITFNLLAIQGNGC